MTKSIVRTELLAAMCTAEISALDEGIQVQRSCPQMTYVFLVRDRGMSSWRASHHTCARAAVEEFEPADSHGNPSNASNATVSPTICLGQPALSELPAQSGSR
jgi:hypothetical protein